jgi:hypothetical protein
MALDVSITPGNGLSPWVGSSGVPLYVLSLGLFDTKPATNSTEIDKGVAFTSLAIPLDMSCTSGSVLA